MNALLEANQINIPQTLKHQEMHSMQHDAMRRMGIEDHDQAPPLENFADSADKRVRLGLLIRQLIADQPGTMTTVMARALDMAHPSVLAIVEDLIADLAQALAQV